MNNFYKSELETLLTDTNGNFLWGCSVPVELVQYIVIPDVMSQQLIEHFKQYYHKQLLCSFVHHEEHGGITKVIANICDWDGTIIGTINLAEFNVFPTVSRAKGNLVMFMP